MIKPSKDAKIYRLVLDPLCPLGKLYFQANTFFMHPTEWPPIDREKAIWKKSKPTQEPRP